MFRKLKKNGENFLKIRLWKKIISIIFYKREKTKKYKKIMKKNKQSNFLKKEKNEIKMN